MRNFIVSTKILFLVTIVQAVFSVHQANINSIIPNEVIVVLTSPSEHTFYESSVPFPYSSAFSIGKKFQAYLYKNINASTFAILSEHPSVDYVEANGILHALDVQEHPPSWGLKRVSQRKLPLNDEYVYPNSAGKGARVYIVDTGINLNHQDFGGRAEFGVTINTDGGDEDCNGHGTHVSGTVGGTQFGVAKQVTLVHVKVLGCDGSGTFSEVIAGIEWVVKDKAAHPGKITSGVITLSLGGSVSQSVNDAVDAATDGNLLSVVAAGNDKFADACTKSPASAESAFTIAAADDSDKPASFTNLGNCVNLWAPGVNINSTWIGSDTDFRILSGTSMAAAHVAGMAALLLGKVGYYSVEMIVTHIMHLSTPDQIDYGSKTFANDSEISSPFFRPNFLPTTLLVDCVDDDDCSRNEKCCLESGLCIASWNTCCGTVPTGCSSTSTCCPGYFAGPFCARSNYECCGDSSCSLSQKCCRHELGDFCSTSSDTCCGSTSCSSGSSCCTNVTDMCCPSGSGWACNGDRTCTNTYLILTPNQNLFNGGDVVNSN